MDLPTSLTEVLLMAKEGMGMEPMVGKEGMASEGQGQGRGRGRCERESSRREMLAWTRCCVGG